MKRILTLLLSFLLIFAVMLFAVSCNDDDGNDDENNENEPCEKHIDSDENGACDECGEKLDDDDANGGNGEEDEAKQLDVTVKIADQDGLAVGGVVITFFKDGESVKVTEPTGADGSVAVKIAAGEYAISCDTELTDGYYLILASSLNIVDGTAVYELEAENNTPNGTAERPYPLTHGDNTLTVPAGKTVNYIIYKCVKLYVEISGEGFEVAYGEDVYTPEGGKVNIEFTGTDYNAAALLAVKNTTDADMTLPSVIDSIPGTQGNPYPIALGEDTVRMMHPDVSIWYTFTAESDGVLSITHNTDNANIRMQNNTKSTVSTTENGVTTIAVSAGDVVVIDVSTTASGTEEVEVSFTATFSDGN